NLALLALTSTNQTYSPSKLDTVRARAEATYSTGAATIIRERSTTFMSSGRRMLARRKKNGTASSKTTSAVSRSRLKKFTRSPRNPPNPVVHRHGRRWEASHQLKVLAYEAARDDPGC